MLKRLMAVVFLVVALSLFAPQRIFAESSAETSGSSGESSSQESSSSSAEVVEPLDAWHFGHEQNSEKSSSSSSSSSSADANYNPDDRWEVPDRVNEEKNKEAFQQRSDPYAHRPAALGKSLEHSIKIVERKVLQKRFADQERLRDVGRDDPRGAPEVRVCSVNAGTLGARADVKKILRGKGLGLLQTKERSIRSAIATAQCDIVLVQGVVANDEVNARKYLDSFVGDLSKQTEKHWEFFREDSNNRFVSLVTLYKPERANLVGTKVYSKDKLPTYDQFTKTEYPRWPLLLRFRVVKQSGEQRDLLILSYDLQEALLPLLQNTLLVRMQIAEGVRRTAERVMKEFSKENPVLLLAGERTINSASPVARVFEGLVTLADFEKDGGCTIGPNHYPKCDELKKRPKEFFGLFDLRVRLPRRELSFASPWDPGFTPEFYVPPSELYTARKDLRWSQRFALGAYHVETGISKSPLVWLELNW